MSLMKLFIQLLILIWTKTLTENITYVNYPLGDFTPKNKKIGNIVYSAIKQYVVFENVVLHNFENLFDIQTNGDMFTKVDIDRDEVCIKMSCCEESTCYATLKVYFFKLNMTQINIRVSIHDSNDEKPTFLNAKRVIQIPESASLYSTFKLPKATDLDSLKYGIDRYILIDPTNTFVVVMEKNEPSLQLVRLLDREELSSYNIQLTAYDKGSVPQSSSLNLTVNVSDVNDNSPYFVKSQSDLTPLKNLSGSYTIKIKENQSGDTFRDTLYHFHAHDLDEGENAKIYYSISQTQSQPTDVVKQKFSLRSPYETAKVQLRQNLDYENEWERHISLIIVATDNGKPPKSASVTLLIDLLDENDNEPVINETMSKDIKENDPVRTQLKILSVTDRDSVSQRNINCSLSDEANQRFELHMYDWNLYDLHNRVAFNFEDRKVERVAIICVDRGEPQRSQTYNFYVKIIDQNDNIPVWQNEVFKITLQENDNSRRMITTITATDADSGYYGSITYNISSATDPNHDKYVKIDPITAAIFTVHPVDREIYSELVFLITATDNRGAEHLPSNQPVYSSKTKLIIKILDENDNFPRCVGTNKQFKIMENSRRDSIVGTLQFYDADEPPNNILSMSLLEYNKRTRLFEVSRRFHINFNGTIRVKINLDREELNNISLTVKVEDHGSPRRTVTDAISIEILDENDNAPMLQSPKNNTFIPTNGIIQSTVKDTRVSQLEAKDPDNGKNASILYKIIFSNFLRQDLLKIDPNTGEIFTNWEILDQPDVGVYILKVAIEDEGYPPQSTIVTFYVNITTASMSFSAEAYMSNIVILILIIVCSLALIVSLIAAIFWVRFRVSADSTILYQEESFEREHLNKDPTTNSYSLMTMENNIRQNSFDNINLHLYDSYNPRQQSHLLYGKTKIIPNDSFGMLDNSRLTPCEDCFNSFGAVPSNLGRYESPNVARLRSPMSPDISSPYNTISAKAIILQSHLGSDFNSISNTHLQNMTTDPNFSDSGKGGSVEDVNYRQPVTLSTFISAQHNQTTTNTVKSCQSHYTDQNNKRFPQNTNNETIF